MTIQALSFDEARQADTESHPVISIGAPNTAPPPGVRPTRDEHLRLEFDDIDQDPPSESQKRYFDPPQEEHVEEIIQHARDQDGPMMAHCRAGVSRSTAASVIGRVARGEDPEEAMESVKRKSSRPNRISPNSRMMRIADEKLGLDGKLQALT